MAVKSQATETKLKDVTYTKADMLQIERIKKEIDEEYNAKQRQKKRQVDELERMLESEDEFDDNNDQFGDADDDMF